MSKTCLLLMSSTPFTSASEDHQRKVKGWLEGTKCVFKELDGCVEENKEMRNNLFAVSGLRGNYPQLFLVGEDSTEFLGNFETLQGMIESNDLPKELLEKNPDIMTWDKAILDVRRSS